MAIFDSSICIALKIKPSHSFTDLEINMLSFFYIILAIRWNFHVINFGKFNLLNKRV